MACLKVDVIANVVARLVRSFDELSDFAILRLFSGSNVVQFAPAAAAVAALSQHAKHGDAIASSSRLLGAFGARLVFCSFAADRRAAPPPLTAVIWCCDDVEWFAIGKSFIPQFQLC